MDNVIKQTVLFQDLGWMEYQQAWDYQEALLTENVRVKGVLRDLQAGVNRADGVTNQSVSRTNGQNMRATAPAGAASHEKHGTSGEKHVTSSGTLVTSQPKHATTGGIPVADTQNIAIHDPLHGEHRADITLPATKNHLLFVEHPPVYTLGKSGSIENVLISEEVRLAKGISFYHTNRGGDITFHGPEQIVGYPILDLEKFYTDIGKYLRNLEEVIIATVADYGLKGERSPGETGVWMDASIPGKERKICAMGIRCSRWVTMHGFAFNVNTDLTYFDYIIPCGIQNKQVTSMEKELGQPLDMVEVKERLKANFEKVFNVELKVFRNE